MLKYKFTCVLMILFCSKLALADSENINSLLKNIQKAYSEKKQPTQQTKSPVKKGEESKVVPTSDISPTTPEKLEAEPDNSTNLPEEIIYSEDSLDPEDLGIPVGEELILTAQIDRILLGDFFAFKTKKSAQIGILSLVESLDFPINVNLDELSAKGWFIKESNKFELFIPNVSEEGESPSPLQNGQVVIGDNTFVLDSENFRVEVDDIYIDAEVISQWFAINFEFDFNQLRVKLESKRMLPIQSKLARENKKVGEAQTIAPASLPNKKVDYKAWSTPVADINLSARYFNDSVNSSVSVIGSQDIAYHNAQYFLNGDQDDLFRTFRIKFNKESIDNSLLGPLNASKYEFGDITPIRSRSRSYSGVGRGVSITNSNIQNVVDFETVNLSGDIQPDWDVELYRNDVLIANQLSLEDGRYEFNDVRLLYGDNEMKLVFYGPQGQIETKIENYRIDAESARKRNGTYGVSLVNLNSTLFGTQSSQNSDLWSFNSTYKTILFDALPLDFEFAEQFGGDEESIRSASVGSYASIANQALISGFISTDFDGGMNYSLSGSSRLGNQSLSLKYAATNNSKDSFSDTSESSVTLAGPVYEGERFKIGHSTFFSNRKDGFGNTNKVFRNDLGFNYNTFTISNNLTWQESEDQLSETSSNLFGSLYFHRYIGSVFTRFRADYEIEPERRFTNYNSELSWSISSKLRSEVSFNYFPVKDIFTSKAGLTWNDDSYTLNGNLEYDQNGEFRVGLFSRFSIGYNPRERELFLSKRTLSAAGTQFVRVFEDKNINGRFDEGEALVKGVTVRATQTSRVATTDSTGMAVLAGLPVGSTTDLIVDSGTLPDPYLITAVPGISITPRSGYSDVVDFPILTASEIEGTVVFLNKYGVENTAANIPINLVNNKGVIVQTAISEIDGYYLFQNLLPGQYSLQIEDAYVQRRELKPITPIKIDLYGKGEVVQGNDFVLEQYVTENGYVVNLSSFPSFRMLNAYWHLAKKRFNYYLEVGDSPFYTKYEDTGEYQLHLSFFNSKVRAEQICEQLTTAKVDCNVSEYTYKY